MEEITVKIKTNQPDNIAKLLELLVAVDWAEIEIV